MADLSIYRTARHGTHHCYEGENGISFFFRWEGRMPFSNAISEAVNGWHSYDAKLSVVWILTDFDASDLHGMISTDNRN